MSANRIALRAVIDGRIDIAVIHRKTAAAARRCVDHNTTKSRRRNVSIVQSRAAMYRPCTALYDIQRLRGRSDERLDVRHAVK